MKILVVVSQSLDAEEPVRITDGKVDLTSSKLTLDKMDEYGVEEALRLREAGIETEIVAVGAGPEGLEDTLRSALALGADRAVHLKGERINDALEMSRALAGVCSEEQADLIFIGGQQGSLDTHGIGPALAERLGWPHVAWVNCLQWSDGKLTGKHDIDDGQESFEVGLPAVITTQQGLNEPRYPTVLNIRRSNQKEVRVLSPDVSIQGSVAVSDQSLEVRPRLGLIVDGKDPNEAAAQMVKFLREEAKVMA